MSLPRLSVTQESRLIDLTEFRVEQARELFDRPFPAVQVRLDLRGVTAGQYRGGPRPCIRYNAGLAARHWSVFCDRTVPHEVAHYIVDQLYGAHGARPHGREWRQLMHAFGADPSRCHSYDVSGLGVRRQRRYAYHCSCRTHQLSTTRHRRILQQKAVYHCTRCGTPLKRTA